MKKIYSFFAIMVITLNALAQTPQGINYQAVARDNTGAILSSQQINVRISIVDSANVGTVAYSELHKLSTNQFGLFTLVIGNGAQPVAPLQVLTGPLEING